MHFLRSVLFVFLFAACDSLNAQQKLSGKVYEAFSDSVIAGASIFNTRTKATTTTPEDGTYSIDAAEADVIIFSAAGFKPDTITVSFSLLLTKFDLSLHRHVVSLKEVRVTGNYSIDSLNRRNYYRKIHEDRPGITGRNRPADGVGITLSPASFFSKESKQKRSLRKRLEKEEQERYIDHAFPLPWIKSVTGLNGDSLSLFMYRYRPSYSFCRKTDRQQMLLYINDKLREFRKPRKNR